VNRTRRWLIGGAIAAGLLVLADTVLWAVAIYLIETTAADQIAAAKAEGWQATLGPPERGGWPLAARVIYDSAVITETGPNGTAWHSTAATLGIDIRHPNRLEMALTGPHTLRLAGSSYALRSTSIDGSITLGRPPMRATLTARGVQGQAPGGPFGLAELNLTVDHLPQPTQGEPSLIVQATLAGIDLPAVALPTRVALPTHIAHATLTAALTGRLPERGLMRREVEAWRASDGALAIKELSIEWGKLTLTAEASLHLDAALQPEGNARLKAAGMPEALDTAAAAGLLPASTARAAKAVLMLVPKSADGDIQLPMSLSGRMLTVARFPLVRMPELVWPEPQ